MFAVRIQGGLGNQIFQYLLALELKERFPEADVRIDLNSYRRFRPHNGYELERWVAMDPSVRTLKGREYLRLTGKLPYIGSPGLLASSALWAKVLRKGFGAVNRCIDLINARLPEKEGYVRQEYVHGYPQAPLEGLTARDDRYFDGTWFSQQPSRRVLQRFRLLPQQDPAFREAKAALGREASVGIHIRHGDYPDWGYEILSLDYYRNAIGFMQEQLEDPRFYIFSDDPEYARTAIAPLCGETVTVMASGRAACLDLQLLASCRHHIIANSTFSLAARLLSGSEGLLTAPTKWINGNKIWEIPGCHYLEP